MDAGFETATEARYGASDRAEGAIMRLAGATIRAHPADIWPWITHLAPEVALTVAAVELPRVFVLSGGVPMGEAAPHGASR